MTDAGRESADGGNHEDIVRKEFARQAEAMAGAALFNDQTVLARIRDAARVTRDSRVLDVACGPGIVVEALAPGAGEVVACDITPEMLEQTRRRCRAAGLANVRCIPGCAEDLPFEDSAFDAVVTRSALHHFPDPARALREMSRVLRPGGRVVIVDVMASEDAEQAALHNALETLRDPSHVRMVSKSELERWLAEAGFAVESLLGWTNHREFGEWLKITNAPERVRPLQTVMTELARRGARAGINLRLEEGKLRFEHNPVLVAAVKRGKAAP
ncbi:MAG TPA: methyltransferase domain-containing protein [Burkholderiales bacterium]|nr:methyltransferase domain-containing protein [Burkholderiales bacterium]